MRPPFNAAMIIPTGIGCSIGGHAGDAGPLAKLLAGVCDTLLLHPNVVNASDINEMPENSWYVEGSTLDRLFAGDIGLLPVHSNRILVLLSDHEDEEVLAAAVNTVEAARATWGARIADIVILEEPPVLHATINNQNTADGEVSNTQPLIDAIEERHGTYDAIAISSVIECPTNYHADYFQDKFDCNPWGKAEAILSRQISERFNVPVAHAPMIEDAALLEAHCSYVEPPKAAEAISTSFFHCVLKGLHKAPAIVRRPLWPLPAGIRAQDIHALITPACCPSPATASAALRDIPIISIFENGHQAEQTHRRTTLTANNAWEAAGLLLCIREGIDPATVRRPIFNLELN